MDVIIMSIISFTSPLLSFILILSHSVCTFRQGVDF